MLGVKPRVALLSFSTRGSATIRLSAKSRPQQPRWQEHKAEKLFLEADFDGELQVDAALEPEIAERKLRESKVAGRASNC